MRTEIAGQLRDGVPRIASLPISLHPRPRPLFMFDTSCRIMMNDVATTSHIPGGVRQTGTSNIKIANWTTRPYHSTSKPRSRPRWPT